ncbi:MAG TPA: S41 family peptidase, partial [Bacteroidales bacterium]|nr:S41 family peptidase [Bacteroidales bacterium]
IIMSINNTLLDRTNYYSLYSGKNYSVQLGAIESGSLVFTGKSLTLSARVTITNPSLHHEILDIDGVKIGYLAYVEFLSGENGIFLPELDNIFGEFKNAGITELIVDLRYNPGGDIGAVRHLASGIAPFSVTLNSEILVKLNYNNGLQRYLEDNNYSDYLSYKFKTVASNVNLSRVFVLTTNRSASASELLIIGLKPYMNVVQIGDTTYGKYAGSWVIPDDGEKWAMMPIVMKFSNTQGFTDFEKGLFPDHVIEDDPVGAPPFGDPSDPMVAKAIELATGTSIPTKKAKMADMPKLKQLYPEEMAIKRSLIINRLEQIIK